MVDIVKSSVERKLQRDQSDRFTPVLHRKYPVLRERWSEATTSTARLRREVPAGGNLAESPARVRFWRILTDPSTGTEMCLRPRTWSSTAGNRLLVNERPPGAMASATSLPTPSGGGDTLRTCNFAVASNVARRSVRDDSPGPMAAWRVPVPVKRCGS
jgi:hypothetical protein